MSIFNKQRTSGLMDVIRCDESSYLIWKWHPAGSQVEFDKRANEIRWGLSLRVKDGEVAVFVYKQKNGTMQDYIEGPFDQTIKTSNFPVLASIIGLAFDGTSPFQAEVYFINLAKIIQVKFGVPFFDVYDPRFSDFGVPVAVRGTINFKIDDYREFIKLHRMDRFTLEDFQREIKDAVVRYVKDVVANEPTIHNIPVIQIETKTALINEVIESSIVKRFKEMFGVVVSNVDIGTIEIDKSSEDYRQLMNVTKDVTNATVKAQTEANIKNIHDKQRIEAENYEELLRIRRQEEQYAQHKATQSANFAVFQVEKQAEVGIAGAQALGQMGANGAGSVSLDRNSGFNPAAMMASMTVGGVVGQNMVGMMNNVMSGVNLLNQGATSPIPVMYNVAVDGQAIGPYDVNTLKQMAMVGKFSKDSLVWTAGMNRWVVAEMVDELKEILANVMPPIPKST